MRLATALLGVSVALGACSTAPCEDEGICDQVEQDNLIGQHNIQARQGTSFVVDGKRYHLVHFEYGTAEDCMAGCFYSHYCTVVVDGKEHPAWFSFNTKEDYLFDPLLYCPLLASDPSYTGGYVSSDFKCSMPAYALPLFADAAFIDWVQHPDDVNDALRWCRNEFALGYSTGELP